ncbi:MAG: right-handed parallel beta-helix repeat-containing protein [Phycisphaerae bacterium]|nr:right-handed parallel beta-helix repeat-containing protein [Phycisphaerae bacterium]
MKADTVVFNLAAVVGILVQVACPLGMARTIRVANDGSADYATIQAAIEVSVDGDTVLVAPGTYTGDGNRDIDFGGKAITVRSEAGPGTCSIDAEGSSKEWHRGFYFHNGEQADSVLDGFTITGGYVYLYGGGGILCSMSSPTIRNCVIVGNAASAGGGLALGGLDTVVFNCVIAGNRTLSIDNSRQLGGGLVCEGDGHVILRNCTLYANHALYGGGVRAGLGRWGKISLVDCILFGNRTRGGGNQISRAGLGVIGPIGVELRNCLIEDDPNAFGASVDYLMSHMTDCIWGDPLFANPGHWNSATSWTDGDYHLKSQAGRWDPNTGGWVQDNVTSPCIDAGDPNSPIGLEPFPNGGRINMGAYGGTAEASKSYFGEPVSDTIIAGDINGDGKVDWLDLDILASHWLQDVRK